MSYKFKLEIINKNTGEYRISFSTFPSEKIAQEHVNLLKEIAESKDAAIRRSNEFLLNYEFNVIDTSKKKR